MLDHLAIILRLAISGAVSRTHDQDGASLVEYALLLALIAVVALGALIFLGHASSNILNNSAQDMAQSH